MILIAVLLLRRHAEDVGSVESPSRALQADLGIALRPKADNSWYHCNVQIKLVNGLAVAIAAPHVNDLRAARWRRLTLSNRRAISGPLFMIRGVAKTCETRYTKSSAIRPLAPPQHGSPRISDPRSLLTNNCACPEAC